MAERRLRDKIIFITGASGGLGEQIAYQAALQGATLVLGARNQERLLEVRAKCMSLSAQEVFVYQLDVSQSDQIKNVINQIKADLGRVDILVNNAGFGLFEYLADTDDQIISAMFQVNVLGLIQVTKLVGKLMVQKGQGQIINIASQGGKMATPKSTIYSATKAAVISFSNALRLELHDQNIQVTVVNPGPIKTAFITKADRTGKYLDNIGKLVLDPENVAKKVVKVMGTKKRELNLPRIMEVGSRLYNLFPHIGDFLARTIFNRK